MRRSLVAGNWKMHGTRAETSRLVGEIRSGLPARTSGEIVVCPPFPYLDQAAEAIAGSAVALGAQNVSAEAEGAFTGEVSAAMLADIGCRYVIVGHSERRSLYGEDNALVAAKFAAAQRARLVPILCVGESLEQHEAGATEDVVRAQLESVLDDSGVEAFAQAVVAYEPVWAIGTGRTASPEHAQAVHGFIRERVAARDDKIAGSLRVLYGGSVKPSNAAELFDMPDIDGGLIGGASLKSEDFLAICAAAR